MHRPFHKAPADRWRWRPRTLPPYRQQGTRQFDEYACRPFGCFAFALKYGERKMAPKEIPPGVRKTVHQAADGIARFEGGRDLKGGALRRFDRQSAHGHGRRLALIIPGHIDHDGFHAPAYSGGYGGAQPTGAIPDHPNLAAPCLCGSLVNVKEIGFRGQGSRFDGRVSGDRRFSFLLQHACAFLMPLSRLPELRARWTRGPKPRGELA